MMVSQKVVLSGTFEDPKAEIEFGPFSQGVAVDKNSDWASQCLIDVASGEVIVVLMALGYFQPGERAMYRRAFIQTYPSDAPLHPQGITQTMMAACLGRLIEINLSESLERRLRIMAEEVDADFARVGMERLERDEGGSFTDDSLENCILAAIGRGLEAYEEESGVRALPDGTVVPREETT